MAQVMYKRENQKHYPTSGEASQTSGCLTTTPFPCAEAPSSHLRLARTRKHTFYRGQEIRLRFGTVWDQDAADHPLDSFLLTQKSTRLRSIHNLFVIFDISLQFFIEYEEGDEAGDDLDSDSEQVVEPQATVSKRINRSMSSQLAFDSTNVSNVQLPNLELYRY